MQWHQRLWSHTIWHYLTEDWKVLSHVHSTSSSMYVCGCFVFSWASLTYSICPFRPVSCLDCIGFSWVPHIFGLLYIAIQQWRTARTTALHTVHFISRFNPLSLHTLSFRVCYACFSEAFGYLDIKTFGSQKTSTKIGEVNIIKVFAVSLYFRHVCCSFLRRLKTSVFLVLIVSPKCLAATDRESAFEWGVALQR